MTHRKRLWRIECLCANRHVLAARVFKSAGTPRETENAQQDFAQRVGERLAADAMPGECPRCGSHCAEWTQRAFEAVTLR